MSHTPADIAIDVLHRAREAQVRKNALTALGVFAGSAGVRALVEAALSDPDEPVRVHAAAELLRLPPSAAADAARVLGAELEHPERANRAYPLLGALGAQGRIPAPTGLPLRTRWRAARHLARNLQPAGWWKPRGRVMASALMGTAAGFVFLWLLIAWKLEIALGSTVVVELGLTSGLLAALLGWAASIRPTSIHLHAFRGAGALVEVWRAAKHAAALLVVLFVLLFITFLALIAALVGSVPNLEYALLLVPLLGASVRGGTLLGSGIFSDERTRGFWAAATGAAAGLVALAVVAALLLTLMGVDLSALAAAILYLAPVAFGLGWAYSRIDGPGPAGEHLAGRAALPLSVLLVFMVAASVIFFATAPRPHPLAGVAFADTISVKADTTKRLRTDTVVLRGLPARVRFNAKEGQHVDLAVMDDTARTQLAVFSPSGSLLGDEDDHEKIDLHLLTSGRYTVVVDRREGGVIDSAAAAAKANPSVSELLPRIPRRFGFSPRSTNGSSSTVAVASNLVAKPDSIRLLMEWH